MLHWVVDDVDACGRFVFLAEAPLACIVRIGNSSDELHAFAASARTWGVSRLQSVEQHYIEGSAPSEACRDHKALILNSRASVVAFLI